MLKVLRGLSLLLLMLVVISACSANSDNDNNNTSTGTTANDVDKKEESREPVEIVFASELAKSPEVFEEEIGGPIREKFPWITPVYIERGEGTQIEDLVTTGTPPDIFWYVYNRFPTRFQNLGLAYDMSELIKKHEFDLERLDPVSLAALDQYTGGDGIYGLPFTSNASVMYYNKDIFDQFGADYPVDGMTWDEVYDLAVKLTRLENGVQYRGVV